MIYDYIWTNSAHRHKQGRDCSIELILYSAMRT